MIGVMGFAVLFLTMFRGSNVASLSLGNGSTPVPTPALTRSELAGTWKMASGSVAGYRVREQLAFLQSPSDAVGRTSSVTGMVTVTGTSGVLHVTAGGFQRRRVDAGE